MGTIVGDLGGLEVVWVVSAYMVAEMAGDATEICQERILPT